MPASLEIKLSGNSTITRRAERGVIHLRVTSEGESQEMVFSEVTTTTSDLQSSFHQLSPKDPSGTVHPSAAVTTFSTTGLHTRSWLPLTSNGNPVKGKSRRYAATTGFEVSFRDFEKLGQVVNELFKMQHVEVNNIEWRLTDATKASLGTVPQESAEGRVDESRGLCGSGGQGCCCDGDIGERVPESWLSGLSCNGIAGSNGPGDIFPREAARQTVARAGEFAIDSIGFGHICG